MYENRVKYGWRGLVAYNRRYGNSFMEPFHLKPKCGVEGLLFTFILIGCVLVCCQSYVWYFVVVVVVAFVVADNSTKHQQHYGWKLSGWMQHSLSNPRKSNSLPRFVPLTVCTTNTIALLSTSYILDASRILCTFCFRWKLISSRKSTLFNQSTIETDIVCFRPSAEMPFVVLF